MKRVKGAIPLDLRWDVWERDNFTCQECGARRRLSVDHVIPESAGGPTVFDNLQTLCVSCNSQKGARKMPSPDETINEALYNTLTSPNESDRNFEAANVVDGLFAIARSIRSLADAVDRSAGLPDGPTRRAAHQADMDRVMQSIRSSASPPPMSDGELERKMHSFDGRR